MKSTENSFRVGDTNVYLSNAEQLRNKAGLIYSGLYDIRIGKRFYTTEYGEPLYQLMGLHANSKNIYEIYSDIGNIAGYVVNRTKDFILNGLMVDNISAYKPGTEEVEEKETELVRSILLELFGGKFETNMNQMVESGCIFGMMCSTVRMRDGKVEAKYREPLCVFPRYDFENNLLQIYTMWWEYEQNTARQVRYAEDYGVGYVKAYRNAALMPPPVSGETGISRITLTVSPFGVDRGTPFGKSVLADLAESIAENCGTLGSVNRSTRKTANGVLAVSGAGTGVLKPKEEDDIYQNILKSDEPNVLFGTNLSLNWASNPVAANADPIVKQIDQSLRLKSTLYAYLQAGADASGEAIRQLQVALAAEIVEMRRSVVDYIKDVVDIAHRLKFGNKPFENEIYVDWGDPFPVDDEAVERVEQARTTRIVQQFQAGIIPLEVAIEALGYRADDPRIAEFIAKAKAPKPVAANPFARTI